MTLTSAYLELVLLAVDDDSADLLVHEDEDGDEEGGDEAGHVHPPGVLSERHHQPAAVRARRLGAGTGPYRYRSEFLLHMLDFITTNNCPNDELFLVMSGSSEFSIRSTTQETIKWQPRSLMWRHCVSAQCLHLCRHTVRCMHVLRCRPMLNKSLMFVWSF